MLKTKTPVSRTPLHHWHASHGARFADRAGWQVVETYGSAEREAESARSGLGLADISAFTKINLRGKGLPAAMQSLGLGDLKPLTTTIVQMNDPVLACRLTQDQLLLVALTTSATGLEQRLASLPADAFINDVTSGLAGFCLVGPQAEALLHLVTHFDTRLLTVNSCAETVLNNVEVLVVRTAELAMPSMRLYVAWDMAEYVWERLLEAGKRLKITAVGMECLASLKAR